MEERDRGIDRGIKQAREKGVWGEEEEEWAKTGERTGDRVERNEGT